MGKIHLLMKKEDIDQEQMEGKIAVVFDVLLATSTITAALDDGATEVIPVVNKEAALKEAKKLPEDSYILAGEYAGKPLKGFLNPSPLQLRGKTVGKAMILSTTNGTVAINGSSPAKKVFAASLLNGRAVADHIRHYYSNETIVIVCSGSMGRFCMEDFYGAGYFLHCITELDPDWELTDAAHAALLFYKGNHRDSYHILESTRVGKRFADAGITEDLHFVSRRGILPVIPVYNGHAIVNEAASTPALE